MKLHEKIYDIGENCLRRLYNARIKAPPVVDIPTYFPNAEKFINSWQQIHDESLKLAEDLHKIPRFHEVVPNQYTISANDKHDWRIFILKAYGYTVKANLAACPILASTISACPDVLSAAISFLDPGKRIPAHRGPFKGVLRYYLVISMPKTPDGQPAAVLKIAGVEHRLQDGEALLWDDTFEHEVWNNSNEIRIVLLLDVWRRDMPLDMQLLSKTVISMVGLAARIQGVRRLKK